MVKSISEILAEIDKAKTKADKLELLRYYDHQAIRALLAHALDPTIGWRLPPGEPPYKPMEQLDQHGNLYSEVRKFYIFCDPNFTLPDAQRQTLFIQLLESVDPEDAKLVLACKEKTLPYKTITAKLVDEAYPKLLNEVPK